MVDKPISSELHMNIVAIAFVKSLTFMVFITTQQILVIFTACVQLLGFFLLKTAIQLAKIRSF